MKYEPEYMYVPKKQGIDQRQQHINETENILLQKLFEIAT